MPKKQRIGTYLPSELFAKLRRLSKKTRVPLAAYFEEAVTDLLKKHGDKS